MKQVRAKKSLGQHFLNDENTAHRIADTVSAQSLPSGVRQWGEIPLLEIGPGMGMLTKYLLDTGRELTAVELDAESVEFLSKMYPRLNVVEADFLRMNPDEIYPGRQFAVIGNYPYNISTQIFFKILESKDRIPVVSGMLQKEVAERICAAPGGRDRGILSVLLQAWYDCEYLFTVEPFVFTPPPKVRSGVLRLTRNRRTDLGCDPALFKAMVKQAFGQRRKTLRNSLSPMMSNAPYPLPDDVSQMLTLRPERLSVEDFVRLVNVLRPSAPAAQSGSDSDPEL